MPISFTINHLDDIHIASYINKLKVEIKSQ